VFLSKAGVFQRDVGGLLVGIRHFGFPEIREGTRVEGARWKGGGVAGGIEFIPEGVSSGGGWGY